MKERPALIAQGKAADPRTSVWVEASAGSGKTKVLTDRFVNLLLEGADPRQILCLTFTKAAAAEMTQRITATLGRWSLLSDEALKEEIGKEDLNVSSVRQSIDRVLDSSTGLNIQTLHSFCQSVLRRFPLEAGLVPHFKVLDEAGAHRLLLQAQNQVLHQAPTSPLFQESLFLLTQGMDEQRFQTHLKELLSQRLRFLHAMTKVDHDRSRLIKAQQKALNVEATERTIMEGILQAIAQRQEIWASLAVALAQGNDSDQKRALTIRTFLKDPSRQAYEKLLEAFLTAEGDIRKRLVSASLQKKHPNLSILLEEEAGWLLHQEEQRKAAFIADISAAFLIVGDEVLKAYQHLKDYRCLLDYDDLIVKTYQLLRRADTAAWVLYKLDGGIHHILVDEAQDTSLEQWSIIQALSDEFFTHDTQRARTLFIVGDRKQSIYSFQGADPKAFATMGSHFETRAQEGLVPWKSIDLDVCFRCAPQILDVVDTIFAQGHLDRDVRHIPFRYDQEGHVEVWPLVVQEAQALPPPWTIAPVEAMAIQKTPQQRMALLMAQQIHGWLEKGLWLASKQRYAHAGDIMILVRKRSRFVYDMVDALRSLAIPVAGVDRLLLTQHLAVRDLMALGQFALLPDDDLTLASLLKSPLFDLNEEDLFSLAYAREGKSLWQILVARCHEKPYWQECVARLKDFLSRVDFDSPFQLFSTVLTHEGGRVAFEAYFGPQVHDPLDEFLGAAIAYERQEAPSLQGFLSSLEQDQPEIKREADQENKREVRILTVHGAKGLQAPIVILPDTTQTPRTTSCFLWTEGEERTLLWRPSKEDDVGVTCQLKAIQALQAQEEYLRLFYVALTRAEDHLYIGGWQTGTSLEETCWYQRAWEAVSQLGLRTSLDLPGLQEDGLIYGKTIQRTQADKEELPCDTSLSVPSWALTPVQEDRQTIIRPSLMLGDDEPKKTITSAFDLRRLGIHIHKVLQHHTAYRLHGLSIYAKAVDLSSAEVDEIQRVVDRVLQHPDFQALFGEQALAEVPLMGTIEGQWVSGQIDLLVPFSDEIWIIDFKTTPDVPATAEEIPASVLSQMGFYTQLLIKAYPHHRIKAGVLYTYAPILLWLTTPTLRHDEARLLSRAGNDHLLDASPIPVIT